MAFMLPNKARVLHWFPATYARISRISDGPLDRHDRPDRDDARIPEKPKEHEPDRPRETRPENLRTGAGRHHLPGVRIRPRAGRSIACPGGIPPRRMTPACQPLLAAGELIQYAAILARKAKENERNGNRAGEKVQRCKGVRFHHPG